MKHAPRSKWTANQGFSLVEVAFAMAVMGFGLLSIVGLVPMGLTHFRQAMNNTVETQIVQSITSDLQLTSFKSLAAGTTYYDGEGNPTATASSAIYTATVALNPIGGTSFPVSLPGSANSVTITIGNKSHATSVHTYSIIVANQNN